MLTKRLNSDVGAVAVITAIAALLLMAIGALAVDIGSAWARKRAVQTTSDLAALAGASALPDDIAEARRRAIDYLTENLQLGADPLNPCVVTSATANVCWDNNGDYSDGEIDFFTEDANGNGRYDQSELTTAANAAVAVRVVAPGHRVDFGLANAAGFSSVRVTATATAAVGSALGLGVPPFYLVAGDNGPTCIKDDAPGGQNSVVPGWAVRAGGLSTSHSISGIDPTSGPPNSVVTISGVGLPEGGGNGFKVWFGTADATNGVVSRSSTEWVVTVPTGVSGTVNVRIEKNGDDALSPTQFMVTPPPPPGPALTNLSPDNGPVGSTVLINGTNLPTGNPWDAYFDNVPATATVQTSTQWRVAVPAGVTGTVQVSLKRTNGDTTNSLPFTVTVAPPPTPPVLVSLNPSSGPVDTVVSITGLGLPTSGGTATFGGVTAPVDSRSATTWVVRVPNLSPGDYQVVVNNGSNSNGLTFTVTAAGDPCFGDASNRGYIDEPRFDGNAQSIELNIKQGIDHNLHIYMTWPVTGSPRPEPAVGVECDALPDIYKSGASTPLPDINCGRLKSGGTGGQLKPGFFDTNPASLGRLLQSDCGSTGSSGPVNGVDTTPLSQFIDTSKGSYDQFRTDVAANPGGIPSGTSKQGWVMGTILECPRFAFLPVVNAEIAPNGTRYYAIIGFKALYFWDETPEQGFTWTGSNLKSVRALVFDVDYLPAEVSAGIAGDVGPYSGVGPKVVQLVHDQDDPAT